VGFRTMGFDSSLLLVTSSFDASFNLFTSFETMSSIAIENNRQCALRKIDDSFNIHIVALHVIECSVYFTNPIKFFVGGNETYSSSSVPANTISLMEMIRLVVFMSCDQPHPFEKKRYHNAIDDNFSTPLNF